MKANTVVIFASERGINKFLGRNRTGRVRWAYLGEDVLRAMRIEDNAPEGWERIRIAEILQGAAKQSTDAYVNFISSIRKNDDGWWASRISEKNPFVSKAFLHICYLKVAGELIKSGGETVLFVEDKDVFDSIKANFAGLIEARMAVFDRVGLLAGFIGRFISKKVWLVFSVFYQIFLSRRLIKRSEAPAGDLTVVHTFANKGSFDKEGRFRESYFGKMPDWLRDNGKKVVFLTRTLGYSAYGEVMKKLAKNRILLWHRYIGILDAVWILIRNIIDFPAKGKLPEFRGLDVGHIIENDRLNDWIENRKTADMLIYYGIKGMAKNDIRITEFIYTYENQCWEKIAIRSLRRFYPDCRIIGYQHAAFSDMQLNYFFTRGDMETMPFPDTIIASGKYYADVFAKAGYPEDVVRVGGSFRFAHLLSEKPRKSKGNGVLVTFPMDMKQAVELYSKVLGAFRDRKMDVILKFHPFSSPKKIISMAGGEMPAHFRITAVPMPKALEESGTLIYTTSTTCMEAIASGITPINVRSEHFIDMDQLEQHTSARMVARTPEEIASSAEKAMDAKGDGNLRKIVQERFAEVDKDEILQAVANISLK